jgi:hypothetical protein
MAVENDYNLLVGGGGKGQCLRQHRPQTALGHLWTSMRPSAWRLIGRY